MAWIQVDTKAVDQEEVSPGVIYLASQCLAHSGHSVMITGTGAPKGFARCKDSPPPAGMALKRV